MNTTSRTARFAAAVSSLAVTFALVSGVAGLAKSPADHSLLAQGKPVVVAMR